jgi:hypothetical protein
VDAAIEELLHAIHDHEDDDELWFGQDAPVQRDAVQRHRPDPVRPVTVLHTPPGYRRDAVGRWRYVLTGGYVPAARDIRVVDVIPNVRVDGHQLLHATAVRVYPALAFLLQYPIRVRGATPMLEVPVDEWEELRTTVLGVTAPELAPEQLLDTTAVALLCRVSQRTISAYLARGRFVEPVARIGTNPVWSLPVVLQWSAIRGGRQRTRVGSVTR